MRLSSLETPVSLPRKIGDVSSLDLGLRSRIGWVPLVETPPADVIIIDTGVRRYRLENSPEILSFGFDEKSSCEIFTLAVHIDSACLENFVNIRDEAISGGVNTDLHPLHPRQLVEDLLVEVDVIGLIVRWERDILTGQPEHVVLVEGELHHGVVEAEDEDSEAAVEDVAA